MANAKYTKSPSGYFYGKCMRHKGRQKNNRDNWYVRGWQYLCFWFPCYDLITYYSVSTVSTSIGYKIILYFRILKLYRLSSFHNIVGIRLSNIHTVHSIDTQRIFRHSESNKTSYSKKGRVRNRFIQMHQKKYKYIEKYIRTALTTVLMYFNEFNPPSVKFRFKMK